MFSRKAGRKDADAVISSVEMLERLSYGEATVRIVYAVQALDEPRFDVTRESKVRMGQLPQAGQRVAVRFDPADHQKFEVVTALGAESGTPTTPTVVIPWDESERSSYIRPNGTRGFR
jgi:hypothetical protein